MCIWSILFTLIHYVCNAHFHWQRRRKFAKFKIIAFMPWKQRRLHVLSNVTWQHNENVLKRRFIKTNKKVITRFVFEWFAGINCIILRSQIPEICDRKMIQFMPANHSITNVLSPNSSRFKQSFWLWGFTCKTNERKLQKWIRSRTIQIETRMFDSSV